MACSCGKAHCGDCDSEFLAPMAALWEIYV